MKRLWLIFIAIFVGSFGILGWVGTEIFRQRPPIPREIVTTDVGTKPRIHADTTHANFAVGVHFW